MSKKNVLLQVARRGGSFLSLIKKLWQHPKGRVGLILVGLLVFVAVFAPVLAPYDPYLSLIHI